MIPVTVTEHEAFRAEMERAPADPAADPAADLAIDAGAVNPTASRKESEVKRVLSILDDIEKEGGPA